MERPPAHPKLFVLLALALLAFTLPATALGAERTVAVTGKATLDVPNDTARVGFGVSVERRTKAAALRAASARLRAVIVAAQAIPGVGDGDVRTGSISVRKVERGRRTVYRSGQGITVTLHEPQRAGELVGAAVGAGASGVRGPSFFVGDTEAAYGRALAAAFEKARAKAQLLAAQAGATLGPVLTITESGGVEAQPVPANGKQEEAGGDFAAPTKPSTSTVTATVSVVFNLL